MIFFGSPERLTTGSGVDTDIAVSPDGKRIAFVSRIDDIRIWSLPFDARNGEQKGAGQPITATGIYPGYLNLSRDGRKLVFVAFPSGTQRSELWEKSLDTLKESLVTVNESTILCPTLSRDALRLTYVRINSEGKLSTALTPAGGGTEEWLTSVGSDVPEDWSADGRWILGASNRTNPDRYQLCLFPVSAAPHAEKEMRCIAAHADFNLFHPMFSPDDRWIAFDAASTAGSAVYVMPAQGGDWIRITEDTYYSFKASWSPDGKTVYFVANLSSGFFNVWGRHFDAINGKPSGEPFQVTSLASPNKMLWTTDADGMTASDIGLSSDRLVLPIVELSGSIWMLENVDH